MMIESTSPVPKHLSLHTAAPRGLTPAEISLFTSSVRGPAGSLPPRAALLVVCPCLWPGASRLGFAGAERGEAATFPSPPPGLDGALESRGELQSWLTPALSFIFSF